uniref:Uncharacterized protein n=1 Tax=Pongo abelii TaxID=9601 RepID=A0A8I5TTL2_PONAB
MCVHPPCTGFPCLFCGSPGFFSFSSLVYTAYVNGNGEGNCQSPALQACLYSWGSEKKRLGPTHAQRRPCKDTRRRQPSTSQEERPWEKPALPTPWSGLPADSWMSWSLGAEAGL